MQNFVINISVKKGVRLLLLYDSYYTCEYINIFLCLKSRKGQALIFLDGSTSKRQGGNQEHLFRSWYENKNIDLNSYVSSS